MNNNIPLSYFILIIAPFLFGCGPITGKNKNNASASSASPEHHANEKNIFTRYEYTDPIGKRLIIQNSVPRGGTKYTDPDGEVYNYVIFFTRLINETDNPLKLNIDFPIDSYEVPSLPGKYFKILVPRDTSTPEKEPLFNYGLADPESFLDNNIHKPSSLKRTINPKDSSGFYVVICSLIEGAHGTMRTGLSLRGQNLFYRIKIDGSKSNTKSIDKEIHAGSINLKNLTLKK